MSANQTPRPDLLPPSCVHPDACSCEIVETTEIVPTEIPLFIATHGDQQAGLPTAAQARDWLSDRHAELLRARAEEEAKRKTLDAGETEASEVTVSDA